MLLLICDSSFNLSSKSFWVSSLVLHKKIKAPALAGDISKLIYDEFLKLIKGSKEAVNVSDIYAHFVKQPYGIKIGLLPILIGIFFKATEASCAFYNKDEQGRESLITEFDQKTAERMYHMPETLKIMFVKIEGEKQIILDEFKSYVEKNFLNNQPIENPTHLFMF